MLDSFTLAIAATVSALGFALSMNMLRYLIPHEVSMRYWSTSSLLMVTGLLLQSQRGAWPDELTWLLANTLVMSAGACFWQGTAHLADRPLHPRAVPGLVAFSAVANIAIHLWWPEDTLYMAVLSVLMATCFAGAGRLFWAMSRERLPKTMRLTSTLMWLGCALFLFRLTGLNDVGSGNSMGAFPVWKTLGPFIFGIVFFSWSTAVVTFVVGDKLRERLQTALERAEESDLAKSAFLASITHELRTPLNAISGFAQLMTHENQYPTEVRQSAALIQNAGNQLLDVVNDLMDLRALQEGSLSLKFEVSHIQWLMDQALADWQPVARRQGMQLMVKGVASNLTVWVDPARFSQVMRHLVSNAFKFNHPGGTVQVSWREDVDSVVVDVSDTGPGIPEAYWGRLFSAFDRLGAESGDIPGTGVGLSICHQLVQMMGGSIEFRNNPDQGCTFSVRLPQAAVVNGEVVLQNAGGATVPDSNFPSTRTLDPGKPTLPTGKHVLYVEDNVTNQKLVQAVFQKQLGLDVTLALTAEEGLALARERLPNLILMDINLPGLDGYGALKALRADPRTAAIPVMAVTAQSQPEDLEKGKAAGFDAYLTKPLKLGNLVSQAIKLLNR
ncbi:MAG TPA: ATP-binding protein [Burkholderiaceae bacterium]|mgnify:CR=1 FL=1|nr:ATP-binding protein [Burkholderiaceae bacterium]